MGEPAHDAAWRAARHTVWNCMLDAARVTMYAEMRGKHYRVLHGTVRTVLLLSATASATAILDTALGDASLGSVWRLVPNVLIAATVVIDYVADFGTKIAALNLAKRTSQRLVEKDWRRLWDDIDGGAATVEEIQRRNDALLHQLHEATGPMDEHVTVNDKANVLSTERAYKVMVAQYAAH